MVGERETCQTDSTHVQGFFMGGRKEVQSSPWGVRERDTGMQRDRHRETETDTHTEV